jgi:hypothetical protein
LGINGQLIYSGIKKWTIQIIVSFSLMNRQEAYRYLKKYGGLDYLFEHWWALHTDNPFWTVRSIHEICYQNGGLK